MSEASESSDFHHWRPGDVVQRPGAHGWFGADYSAYRHRVLRWQ